MCINDSPFTVSVKWKGSISIDMNNMLKNFAVNRPCFYILFCIFLAVLHFFIPISFYHLGCYNYWFYWGIVHEKKGPVLQWSNTIVSKNRSAYFSSLYSVTCYGFFLRHKVSQLSGTKCILYFSPYLGSKYKK